MRNGTVERLNANPSSTGVAHRCLTVELLTGETISLPYEGKTTCNAIWNRVEGELVARGVVHPQIFGLAIQSGCEWVFVDPDAKLSKYYGKSQGQTNPGTGSVSDGKKLKFHCRVHFYLDALPPNFDIVSLHHYYLQLRQNLVSTPRFPPASIVQPLAYALQCEIGDWRGEQELPRWVQSHPLILSLAPSLTRAHQTLAGLGKEAAQLAFIRAVMPQYNMHLFAMTLKTKEERYAPAWIGVTPKGIEVYQNAVGCNEIPAQPRLTFLWASITKLYFERKKYGIHGKAFPWANSDQKLSFTAATECVPRHMLHLCRSTHQFHLSNHKILVNSEPLNNGHKSCGSSGGGGGGESSCNSTLLSSSSKNEDKMLDLSLWADGLLLTGESSEHQRVSVISNASSNTTSGIVSSSDRVYSLDGSEAEDLELREMPDCCTAHNNHDGNSTSLESLSPRHPPRPPLRPHLNRLHHRSPSTHGNNNNAPKSGKCSGGSEEQDSEAKYWYCDSDCEDCDDSTGPCRSLLVRTIGDKKQQLKCSGHCECNSCVSDEEQENESHQHHTHRHNNTPSMASETTLKAVDFDVVVADSGGGGEGGFKSDKSEGAIKVQSSESDEDNVGEIEEYKLEDEHVYGEISEDPEPLNQSGNSGVGSVGKMKTEEEQQYSTIEEGLGVGGGGGGDESLMRKAPKPKPRFTNCMSKSVVEPQRPECRCKVKDNKCCKKSAKECKKCSTSNVVVSNSTNGLTPKVASLKCLKKAKPPCSSQIKRHISNRHRGEINFSELPPPPPPVNYVEFGEKLQQGRYPSTRTVSDNFDTDSDYVQLPPLAWYPPPRPPPKKPNSLKLWKCVSNKSGNASGKAKQASPPSLSPPVNMSTLPRRKNNSTTNDDGCSGSSNNKGNNLRASKVSSKSTNALNLVGHARPEPPPKPRKSLLDLSSSSSSAGKNNEGSNAAVDARFIATKPQILIQTAYATTAPVAIPSQAQVLVRGSKVIGNNSHPPPVLQHSQSVDNIYDTVASEEPFVPATTITTTTTTLPPYPSANKGPTTGPLIIRPNNYIDVHASSIKSKLSTAKQGAIANHYITNPGAAAGAFSNKNVMSNGGGIGNRCGSVPNNLNNFLIGLQNLKPLSRTPIVHPGATSCLTLNNTSSSSIHTGGTTTHSSHGGHCPPGGASVTQLTSCNRGPLPVPMQVQQVPTTSTTNNTNPRFTTVYTNQLTRSQIQQFKAQLYSDLDYVIFPPKDPRVSQQEYFDSKYTTVSSTNSNPMLTTSAYSINDIPPPYLPPPPPYPSTAAANSVPPPLPKKNPKLTNGRPITNHNNSSCTTTNVTSSITATLSPSPYHHNSFQSLYHPGSTNSHCSSSQYGYYTAASTAGLNSENLQRFLSTQSFTGSNGSSSVPAIYYPSSTQSAPPLPPYKPSGHHVLIENGMRKAVQQLVSSRNSAAAGMTASDERLRMNMKLCRSEESLYSQPTNEIEEQIQAIYNLPPPPPYKRPAHPRPTFSTKQEAFSAAELDLAHLRARCHALELPLLRALCSEGELLNKDKSTKALIQAAKNRIRPTAHAHPPRLSLPPKNPLPIPPKPNNANNNNASHHTTTAS